MFGWDVARVMRSAAARGEVAALVSARNGWTKGEVSLRGVVGAAFGGRGLPRGHLKLLSAPSWWFSRERGSYARAISHAEWQAEGQAG